MENRLRELAKIGDVDPDLVVWAGSLKAAKQWIRKAKFDFLAEQRCYFAPS